jgi:hypothetical protein
LVEAQCRNQTDHARRYAFGGFDKSLMLVALEAPMGIETTADMPHLLAGDQAAKIFASVAGSDKIAGAEYPQMLGGDFCVGQTARRSVVTFMNHLFISGLKR